MILDKRIRNSVKKPSIFSLPLPPTCPSPALLPQTNKMKDKKVREKSMFSNTFYFKSSRSNEQN